MSSRVIQSKHIYDAGFHEFYTYGTGALNSNIGILNSVQTMTIKNGNVGIGTATPTQKLHIEGNIFAKGNVTCSNISVIGDFVTLNTITSNTEQVVVENAGTGPALKVTQTGNNSVAEFYDNESGLAMIVGNNGNIGIGTNVPMAKLDVNGTLTAKNPCWMLTNSTGGNAVYDTTSKIWGSSINNAVYFNTVNIYNGANTNSWNSTTGRFTFPLSGVYIITINMFINAIVAGRTCIISFNSAIEPTSQYFMFDQGNTPTAPYQRNYTLTKLCNANDSFVVYSESGSMTLYLANVHTNFIIQKVL